MGVERLLSRLHALPFGWSQYIKVRIVAPWMDTV